MVVYLLMSVVSLFILLFGKVTKNKNSIFIWTLAALPLIIVSGLRYKVGADYLSYARIFDHISHGYFDKGLEQGFIWLIQLIQFFTSDYVWMFIIVSFITIYLVFLVIRKESKNPILSVYLYITAGLFFASFNGMRQFLSVSIMFYSIRYIKERNLFKFILCMIPAILFHYSSIFYLFLYFLYGKKYKNRTLLMILITFLLFKPIIVKILLFVVSITKYSGYVGGVFDVDNKSIIQIFVNLLLLVFALFYNRKNIKEDKDYSFYLMLHLIYTILTFYIGTVPLISRLRWGVGLPLILFIPEILNREKNRKTRFIFTVIIVLLYFAYFYYTIGVLNYNLVLPYEWIFER